MLPLFCQIRKLPLRQAWKGYFGGQTLIITSNKNTCLDYEKFCSQILDAETNIRFAAVYDEWATRMAGGLREGLESLLSEKSEQELVTLSIYDWKARKDMSKKLGKVTYTLAEYNNIKRFSFYLGNEHLLLVSSEKDADTNVVVDAVIKLYYQNQN